MDRLGIIGAAWRRITTRGLERFLMAESDYGTRLPGLREALEVEELIFLSTCNRVEILFVRPDSNSGPSLETMRRRAFEHLTGDLPVAGEAERCLLAWAGEGALEHLLLVACGLDSAQLGEREIRGQLRQAQRLASELGLSGTTLDWAVERALQVARSVEAETEIAAGRISLAGIGFDAVERRWRELRNPAPVALVGVSPMTERCGEWLRDLGASCVVVNRSEDRGRAMAERLSSPYRSLDDFRLDPGPLSALVTATGASAAVLEDAALGRIVTASRLRPLVVDFGVPSDVDPDAARRHGLEHLDMQVINKVAERSRSRRRAESAVARELVDRALVDLQREAAERALSPVMKELAGRYRETAETGVAKLFRRQLRHLSDEERRIVEGFAVGLAKRFAHVPVVGLRALVGEHGLAAADTFLTASDEEMAWGLRAAGRNEEGTP
ncbi:MAG: hypothetical protein AAGM22_26705 [Acidobacteriota bacterium]